MTIKLFNDISNQLIVYKDEAKPSWSMESLSQDSIAEIFEHCFSQADFLSIQSLACANLYFYEALKKKVEDVDLQKACPFLSIISAQHAEKCGFPAQPPSAFSKFEVIKAYMTMNPHVEAQAGVTLFNFTLPDQLTLREIVQRMGNAGITADIFWNL